MDPTLHDQNAMCIQLAIRHDQYTISAQSVHSQSIGEHFEAQRQQGIMQGIITWLVEQCTPSLDSVGQAKMLTS